MPSPILLSASRNSRRPQCELLWKRFMLRPMWEFPHCRTPSQEVYSNCKLDQSLVSENVIINSEICGLHSALDEDSFHVKYFAILIGKKLTVILEEIAILSSCNKPFLVHSIISLNYPEGADSKRRRNVGNHLSVDKALCSIRLQFLVFQLGTSFNFWTVGLFDILGLHDFFAERMNV
jgi:hypothetical protein